MNNINQLMKQAQQMQAQMAEAQNKINELEINGCSGGGMVKIVITGKGELKKLDISDELMVKSEKDILIDLIIAAHNDAKSKLESKISDQMGSIMPAGLKLPF